ncbi:MAG: PEP-CTERM system histidine kinase PrsK [Acidobacteria bacterium]|nr:PEP-CTERM system histidine kinase PrsK [Acidobacteriota bacterium]
MNILNPIEWTAAVAGVLMSCLVLLFPRFGKGSWLLVLFLMPAAITSGNMAFEAEGNPYIRMTLSFLLIAATGAVFACLGIDSEDYIRNIKIKMRWLMPFAVAGPALAVAFYFIQYSAPDGYLMPADHIFLGPIGYIIGILLLVLSVIILAQMEQIFRHAEESIRWEIKFLLLGIGISFAATIYISSQILLYPPRFGQISEDALSLFPIIFLLCCGMIFLSWKRSSGRSKVVVSHGLVYSSITLLAVGAYLIASSLIARWVSQWGDIGLPAEALIFLLSAFIMAVLLLATSFRHRVRRWIRRNIFAGRYDYRQFWLEATERIRSIDPPEDTAAALADIVHRSLGAIDISVWIRQWNPNRLKLLYSLGAISDSLESEVAGVVEKLLNISEPLSQDDLDKLKEPEGIKDFMENTHASLLVPLQSSNRIVGVITVGPDRSGRPFDWEAREFLRVLAGHAAGEFHKSDLLATLVEAKEDEAFRAFSTFLLHDLKNFASTLSLIAQNAPRHRENPDFQKDAFKSVYDTSEKMKRLCNSLRTFSSTLAADKKSVDLNQVVHAVADNLNTGLKENLKFELDSIPQVLVDQEEVKRVLQNLIINAREAISEDGVIIVRTGWQQENVSLTVEDNGKGMSREFMERELFLPFHTTKSEGLGIGLFQSKKIMDAHGGSIHVESEERSGTTVILTFPVARQVSPQSTQGT